MSTFHYFLTAVTESDVCQDWPAIRSRFGLGDVLKDIRSVPQDAVPCQVSSGPDGRAGVFLSPKRGDDGELPATLKWVPGMQWMDRGDGCLLCWGDEPPSPVWLRRRKTYPGYLVADEYERQWSVPVIKGPEDDQYGSLPRAYSFDRNGNPTPQLSPDFEHLWQMACVVHDCYLEDREVDTDWLLQMAVTSVAINQRVGFPEMNAYLHAGMPVMDDTFARGVLHAIIDIRAQLEYLAAKKKDSDLSAQSGSSSTHGEPAESEDTAPVSVS